MVVEQNRHAFGDSETVSKTDKLLFAVEGVDHLIKFAPKSFEKSLFKVESGKFRRGVSVAACSSLTQVVS